MPSPKNRERIVWGSGLRVSNRRLWDHYFNDEFMEDRPDGKLKKDRLFMPWDDRFRDTQVEV